MAKVMKNFHFLFWISSLNCADDMMINDDRHGWGVIRVVPGGQGAVWGSQGVKGASGVSQGVKGAFGGVPGGQRQHLICPLMISKALLI